MGDVADNLSRKLLSDKKADIEKRDVACIGLKTVIAEVNSGVAGQVLVKRVAPQLIGSLSSMVCSWCAFGLCRNYTCSKSCSWTFLSKPKTYLNLKSRLEPEN